MKYWMITDRNLNRAKTEFSAGLDTMTFWMNDSDNLEVIRQNGGNEGWTKVRSINEFKNLLIGVLDPIIAAAEQKNPDYNHPANNEDQKHLTLLLHGYNQSWIDAVRFYKSLCGSLYSGNDGLGICILFSWPSDGMVTNYLPDRADARKAAEDLAVLLSVLYEYLLSKQNDAIKDPAKACRVKISIIAHSMGNYLLQKAMPILWTRKNQPLLISLITQLVMAAADVDNDLFNGGESVDKTDGDAIAHLTYRVTALYSGLDPVLGISAGLKHFGKRRLGRSGLDRPNSDKHPNVPDNVWDVDCTPLIPPGTKHVHSVYFEDQKLLELLQDILRGVDRKVILNKYLLPGT